jgi:hypothetical protein
MKVQVTVKNLNKDATASTAITATVGPADTVSSMKDLIASLTKTFSFPDQKLFFKGTELANTKRLSECGVKDGDALEFVFQASEQTLVKQLSDLIGNKSVSIAELSLLYSYRYAVSFEDALKALGYTDSPLRGFLDNQKCFSVQGDNVKLVSGKNEQAVATTLCPIQEDKEHGLIEVSIAVEVHVDGQEPELLSCDEDEDTYVKLEASETVAKAKTVVAALQQMPFPDRDLFLGKHKLKDEMSLADAGVRNGSTLHMVVHASEQALASQLEELLSARKALSANELGLHYCQRFGTPVGQALRTLGLHANLGRFLQGKSQFSISGGCVTLACSPKLCTP